MKPLHMRTDSQGITIPHLSDDSAAFYGGVDRDLNLHPNTDYTVMVREGKPGDVCVWARTSAGWYQPGCKELMLGKVKRIGQWKVCPYCALPLKVRAHYNKPSPMPEGYREMEDWEKDAAKSLGMGSSKVYALYAGQWFRVAQDHWPEGVDKFAVPINWTLLPKCRDCDYEDTTGLVRVAGGWRVMCSISAYHTCGPTKATRVEAIEAYPKA